MALIDRVKNILLQPKTEWDVIAAEAGDPKALTLGYVLPLAAIGNLAVFIGISMIGALLGGLLGVAGAGFFWGFIGFIYSLVMAVVTVFVMAFIIDALAPTFGGQKSYWQAFKLAAYTYTPVWVGMIVGIIPPLLILVLIAALYAIYLLYLGVPKLMKTPEDKAIPYTVTILVIGIVVSWIIFWIRAVALSGAFFAGAVSTSPVVFDKGSPMGKLEDFANKMEVASKKMEAAEKSGDPGKQAAAAMEALGTALGGGKRVDPVQIDQLKPLLPEKFAGLPRTSQRAERSGMAAMMVAEAEAVYSEAGKRVKLEITDTGGASGLMGLAGWMGVTGEKEDEDGMERTRKEGGRLIHERASKKGGSNKFSVVLADRFIVNAEGTGVDLGTLKSAVASLDLAKLESMKTVGVQN